MNFYLNKYGFLEPQVNEKIASDLALIVVIPSYNEPDLITTLASLEACVPTKGSVEVIIVVNSSEHEAENVLQQNQLTLDAFNRWNVGKHLSYHLIHQKALPKKHAGVGLARKIGMDEAVARFHQIDVDGVIVCFDADSTCEPNYLKAIEAHFSNNPKSPACSIHFEHPLSGDDYESQVYTGIINYELHLRYYNQCLRFCQLPYAFHTVGSSMAVRSSAYQKQGGMNKRKAGEDFYFIHKIIALGGFTELKSTTVFPSPRTSDRVPFGTGKAIADWIEKNEETYFTYSFSSFKIIRQFVALIPDLYSEKVPLNNKLQAEFVAFLNNNHFEAKLQEIKQNSTDINSFIKRFYSWFDAFKVLKAVHYLRDNLAQNEPIVEACQQLYEANQWELNSFNNPHDCLTDLRVRERTE